MKRTANLIVQHLLWRGFYYFSVLILNILISRYFAAEKSGQIYYIVYNLSFVLLVASISLESGTIYYISSGKLGAKAMARFCLLWILVAGSAVALGWWFVLTLTHSTFPKDLGFLAASFLFISGVLGTTFFSALFYAGHRFATPNQALLVVNAGLIVLLLLGKESAWIKSNFLDIYFFCYFLQGLLLTVIFFYTHRKEKGGGLPGAPILRLVMRYSLTALLANTIYFLVNRMDYWFVAGYCTSNDLGNYIQASKLGQLLLVIPSILSATLFPLISSGRHEPIETSLAPIIRVLFWINLTLCLLISATGYWLFPALFGKSFSTMYAISLLLMPGLLCLTCNYPLTAANSGNDLIRRNITGSVIALCVIATGDILILPSQGVKSAAAISSVGYFAYYCYILFCYRRTHPSRLGDYFLLRRADFSWLRSQIKTLKIKAGAEPGMVQEYLS